MATRSRIAYSDYDVVSVYHHWDGYPSGLGKHLVENYPTLQDAIKLVCLLYTSDAADES